MSEGQLTIGRPVRFPPELDTVLGQLCFDLFTLSGEIGAIASALHHVDETQRRTIRRFLEKTLSGPYNARRLLNLIWKSPADAGPAEPEDAIRFLELIRDSIDEEGRIVPPV
jgi:hypothetical protein